MVLRTKIQWHRNVENRDIRIIKIEIKVLKGRQIAACWEPESLLENASWHWLHIQSINVLKGRQTCCWDSESLLPNASIGSILLLHHGVNFKLEMWTVMVFELSDYTNQREMTTVGALYDFLTSKSGGRSWRFPLLDHGFDAFPGKCK